MPSHKLEKLKILSPLAAAIAFAAAMPTQIQAQAFTIIDNDEGATAQDQLDGAIDYINEGEGSGSHSITFAADVSESSLYLQTFSLYGEGSLTIDGASAVGLELILTEGEGGLSVGLNNASLSINDVQLTIERYQTYSYDPAFNASYGSNLEMSNVTIDVADEGESYYFRVIEAFSDSRIDLDEVHLDAAFEAEGLMARGSSVSISNSSFTGFAYYDVGIEVVNGYESNQEVVSITNTTFEENGSNGGLLVIETYGNYTSVDFTLDNVTFKNNYSDDDLVFIGARNGDGEGSSYLNATLNNIVFDSNTSGEGDIVNVQTQTSYSGYQYLNFILTNSTFSNNESNGATIRFNAKYQSSYAYSELNAAMGNVTLTKNTSRNGTVQVYAQAINSGNIDVNFAAAHITMVDNGPADESSYAYSGLQIYNNGKYSETDVNVDIVNSIISGNLGSGGSLLERTLEGPSSYQSIDSDIDSNIDINIDNSLIGADNEGEGDIKGKNNIFGEDPMLGKLADNGGMTKTMLPKVGSPVIDAGKDDFADFIDIDLELLFDQRDEKRVRGEAPDMGAVETVPVGEEPTTEKKSLFGSLGLGSLLASFGLLGLRRKRK